MTVSNGKNNQDGSYQARYDDAHHKFSKDFFYKMAPLWDNVLSYAIKDHDIEGEDRIKEIISEHESSGKGKPVFIYTPLHRSNLDGPLFLRTCYKSKIEPPRVGVGDNLYCSLNEGLLKKSGCFKVYRSGDNARENVKIFSKMIKEYTNNREPILIFPEEKEGKTGRSYDSSLQEFTSLFAGPPIHSHISHDEIYFVPNSISYDRVVEDQMFDFLSTAYKTKSKTKKGLMTFLVDIPFLLAYPLFQKKVSVKVNIGEPMKLSSFEGKKRGEISKELRKKAAYQWEVFPTPLVSYSIMQEYGYTGKIISKDRLEKRIEENIMILKDEGAKIGKVKKNAPENIEYFLKHFDQLFRREVSYARGAIEINRLSTIEKNANLITHLMQPEKYF